MGLFLDFLNEELSMPNIPMETMGGEVFWIEMAHKNGYRLQKNMVFHNARILDENNVRIAWGTINGMMKEFDRIVRCVDEYE